MQEFLLQVGKILTELRKQEEQNNTGYAEQAEIQIRQTYSEILLKSNPAAISQDDGIGRLLLELYLESIGHGN